MRRSGTRILTYARVRCGSAFRVFYKFLSISEFCKRSIDSSVIIAAERGKINFAEWLQYDQSYISPITVTELLIGVSRANTEERRMKRSVFVEHVINSITVLDFGVEEARVYNQILYNLFIENLTIAIYDMLIAASAIAQGYPLLTLNGRDFKRIKGLEVLEVQDEQLG